MARELVEVCLSSEEVPSIASEHRLPTRSQKTIERRRKQWIPLMSIAGMEYGKWQSKVTGRRRSTVTQAFLHDPASSVSAHGNPIIPPPPFMINSASCQRCSHPLRSIFKSPVHKIPNEPIRTLSPITLDLRCISTRSSSWRSTRMR